MPDLSNASIRLLKRLSKSDVAMTSGIDSSALNELLANRYVQSAETVSLDLDPIHLPSHTTAWKITDAGRNALSEYRRKRAWKIIEMISVAASIAGLVIALLQLCGIR